MTDHLPELSEYAYDFSALPRSISAFVREHDPHGFWIAVLATLACVYVLLKIIQYAPLAWGWMQKKNSTWKEEREMRRERLLLQQKALADAIEKKISELLDEGDMDPETASYWRSFFAQKLPDLRQPKNVKAGILLRVVTLGLYRTRAPLPDAEKPLMTGDPKPFGTV